LLLLPAAPITPDHDTRLPHTEGGCRFGRAHRQHEKRQGGSGGECPQYPTVHARRPPLWSIHGVLMYPCVAHELVNAGAERELGSELLTGSRFMCASSRFIMKATGVANHPRRQQVQRENALHDVTRLALAP